MIAFMGKVPVLPIAMKRKFKIFRKNELCIGKAFDYSDLYGQKFNSELDKTLTERLRDNLQRTVDEAQGKTVSEIKI